MDFTKIIHPGTVQINKEHNVIITITYKDGCLSIQGVIGPRNDGDAISCGQIYPLELTTLNSAWTQEMVNQFNQAWERWHLNDMRAGSQMQESFIRQAEGQGWKPNPRDFYHSTCELLRMHGILVDPDGYTYGTEWKTEEVPADVLQWLQDLPDSDVPLPRAWKH